MFCSPRGSQYLPESQSQHLRYEWWQQIRNRQITNLQQNLRAHLQQENNEELATRQIIKRSQSIIQSKHAIEKCIVCGYLQSSGFNGEQHEVQQLRQFVNSYSEICDQHFRQLLLIGRSLYCKYPELPALLYHNATISELSESCLLYYLLFMGQVLSATQLNCHISKYPALLYTLQNCHLDSLLNGQIECRIAELKENSDGKSIINHSLANALWKLCRNAALTLDILTVPAHTLTQMMDSTNQNECMIAIGLVSNFIASQKGDKTILHPSMIIQLIVDHISSKNQIASIELRSMQIELVHAIISTNCVECSNRNEYHSLSQLLQPNHHRVMDWLAKLKMPNSNTSQQLAEHTWNIVQDIAKWAQQVANRCTSMQE